MDSQALRDTYDAINERFCPFEKGILTNHCHCSLAERFCIAEREGVGCGNDGAQARCIAFLDLVRARARFALKTTDAHAALPHAKAMRVQVGGLRGVRQALQPDYPTSSVIADIDALLNAALARYGDLDALPWQVIVQQINAWRGRRPLRERR